MARVYEAEDIRLDRHVAVKVLLAQFTADADFLRRFQQEARLAASLAHPNVVRVYDVGQDGASHFIVMEMVDGHSLKDKIRESAPLPVAEALRIALEVCAALSAAHARGLIHRDIKPQNILLTHDGQVKVTDFGIARQSSSNTMTQTGTVLGSVHYLSPEQARGQEAGPRADLYALGVTLFEMLTGRLPFDSDNPVAVAMQHVQNSPPLPRQFNRSISPNLEAIVLRLLAKNPAERYADAGTAAEALRSVLTQATGRTRVAPSAYAPMAGRNDIAPGVAPASVGTRIMPVTASAISSGQQPASVASPPTRRSGRRSLLVGSAFGAIAALVIILATAVAASGGPGSVLGFGGQDASPTFLPTATETPDPSATLRPTATRTPTKAIPTATRKVVVSRLPAHTDTPTPLATVTAAPSFTYTDTPVPPSLTPTDTPTATATATNTATPTNSPTATNTAPPTQTFTSTPTFTATSTPQPTNTAVTTPTETPVASVAATSVVTPGATLQPTNGPSIGSTVTPLPGQQQTTPTPPAGGALPTITPTFVG